MQKASNEYASNTSVFMNDCIFVPDLSLFDELDNLGDADDLLVALEKGSYVSYTFVSLLMRCVKGGQS